VDFIALGLRSVWVVERLSATPHGSGSGETRNLSRNAEYADIERRMETRLLDFFMRTADVLEHKPDSRHI
jgi:hypothetical protein